MRTIRRLERDVAERYSMKGLGDYAPEVAFAAYFNLLKKHLEDNNQPAYSFEQVRDALQQAVIPSAIKKQLKRHGYLEEEQVVELVQLIKGEI